MGRWLRDGETQGVVIGIKAGQGDWFGGVARRRYRLCLRNRRVCNRVDGDRYGGRWRFVEAVVDLEKQAVAAVHVGVRLIIEKWCRATERAADWASQDGEVQR